MEARDYRIDNAKCILIYLVVLGHLLELVPGAAAHLLYQTIYLYHMPLFVFVTGLFASRRSRASDWRMIWLYVVFQTGYQVFDAVVLQGTVVTWQYTRLYWLLWYLLCTILYRLIVPLIDVDGPARQMAVLLGAVAVSLLAGYEESIGYYLTLSRFFMFLPFFLLGYYGQKDREAIERLFRKRRRLSRGLPWVCCLAVAGSVCWLYVRHLSSGALYGSMSYSQARYTAGAKMLMLCFGVCGIGLLPLVWKDRLPVVTQLGRNSLAVYLLHGFAVRGIGEVGGSFTSRPI